MDRAFCEELVELVHFLVNDDATSHWKDAIIGHMTEVMKQIDLSKINFDTVSFVLPDLLLHFISAIAIFGGHYPFVRIGGNPLN